MDSPAAYFHWGFILISIPNLAMVIGMLVLFLIGVVLHVRTHDSQGPR